MIDDEEVIHMPRRMYWVRVAADGWIVQGPDPSFVPDSAKGPPRAVEWPVEVQAGEDPDRAWHRVTDKLRELIGPPGEEPLVTAYGVAHDAVEALEEFASCEGIEDADPMLAGRLAELRSRLDKLRG